MRAVVLVVGLVCAVSFRLGRHKRERQPEARDGRRRVERKRRLWPEGLIDRRRQGRGKESARLKRGPRRMSAHGTAESMGHFGCCGCVKKYTFPLAAAMPVYDERTSS